MLISYKKPKGRFFIVGKPGGSPAVMRHISINVNNGLGTLYIDGNAVTLDANNTWEADIADGTQITMEITTDSDHNISGWHDTVGNITAWQSDSGWCYDNPATLTISDNYTIGTQIDTYHNVTVVVDPSKYTLIANGTTYTSNYTGKNISGICDEFEIIPQTGYQFNSWGSAWNNNTTNPNYWCYRNDAVITPDVTAVTPTQPNDEIWYTSTNGQVVTPYSVSFGTGITVTSNTYADGKGIIKLSGNATTIGANAFKSRTKLATIDIPNGVTSIGDTAFDSCSNLATINIPNGVTSIGAAFGYCSALTSITIPNTITSIGTTAFSRCTGLTSITCEATTPPTLGYNALYDTNSCPIYVPAASVTAYQGASGWSTYSSRIQAIP